MSDSLWQRFQDYYLSYDDLGISLDVSRMKFADGFLAEMQPRIAKAFEAMQALEGGALANPDEQRMVGHYWLRNAALAPNELLRAGIVETNRRIERFASDVHVGRITPADGKPFEQVLLIGIGGSALGPQFIADALGTASDPMEIAFLDNTDPDGFDRVSAKLERRLARTLVVVISKSGGTKETRNGMLEVKARMEAAGLDFAKQAVAVTGPSSELDQLAERDGWLARFPMHDWVGGRTSVMSAVGLLPAALEGFDISQLLAGAAAMDERTRVPDVRKNAAMMLACMWFYAGDGRGKKDMVILPYKDRLMLFSRYLQQLVMESLGKEKDLDGKVVRQGIAVYGNKGSTDQHAYVQQLRDGVLNFFLTFIEVRKDRATARFEVEPGVTSGDYLQGFLRGTRAALYESDRESITLSLPEVNAFTVGALIALYERAVGYYGTLTNVNAYHQPGVEAGKKAATRVLELQAKVIAALTPNDETAEAIALRLGADAEEVFHTLLHLAANGGVAAAEPNAEPGAQKFSRSR